MSPRTRHPHERHLLRHHGCKRVHWRKDAIRADPLTRCQGRKGGWTIFNLSVRFNYGAPPHTNGRALFRSLGLSTTSTFGTPHRSTTLHLSGHLTRHWSEHWTRHWRPNQGARTWCWARCWARSRFWLGFRFNAA